MIVLIAVGAMNIAVMAALAVVILIEKVWKYGRPFSMAVGGALLRRRRASHRGTRGCFPGSTWRARR